MWCVRSRLALLGVLLSLLSCVWGDITRPPALDLKQPLQQSYGSQVSTLHADQPHPDKTAKNFFSHGAYKTEANISRCQSPKVGRSDVLADCPRGTVFVSQTHPSAHFKTINAALQSLDGGSAVSILIDTGTYTEKVLVKRKSPTVLIGVTGRPSNPSVNGVTISQSSFVNQKDPSDKKANCDAVTLGIGSNDGTGSSDFKAYNINFVQRQIQNGQEVTQTQLGPAAALCVQHSRASFYGCEFSSYQDTIYVGIGSQAMFYRSIVTGMTDQLYGEGRAWFEKCLLLSRACGGGIAAWKGSGVVGDKSGVYISNSRIAPSPDAQTLRPMKGACHLGRPWNQFAKTVYLSNFMTDIIAPEGFKTWNKLMSNFEPASTHFMEYGSTGPGGDMTKRDRAVQKVLTKEQAAIYTYQNIFDAHTEWLDTRALQGMQRRHHSHPHDL